MIINIFALANMVHIERVELFLLLTSIILCIVTIVVPFIIFILVKIKGKKNNETKVKRWK
jgi:heme/copper-type cytochrome/quinol oxidase subunit 2